MGNTPTDPDQHAYQRLVEGVGNGAFAFIGAGVSRALGYPAWTPLLDSLHEACAAQGVSIGDLETIKATGDYLLRAHEYEKRLGRKFVCDEIVKVYGPRDQKTSPLHRALIEVDFDHYLTTNYDLGIEEAHAVEGMSARTLDIREPEVPKFIQAINSRWGIEKTVLHIHGRVDQPQSIVLALKDYRSLYSLDPKPATALRTLLYGKSFVFIGYNLNDPPFNVILDDVAAMNVEGGPPQHWVIMAKPESLEAERLLLKVKYNIEPIFYENVDGRHEALIPLIAKIAEDVTAFREQAGRLGSANIIDTIFDGGDTSITRDLATQRLRRISLPKTTIVSAMVAVIEQKDSDQKTPFDHRIDAQVEIMKQGFFEKARERFQALLQELPPDAEPRLRYRLHANIVHCLLQLDRFDDVIPHCEAAYASAPEKPDAKWMHAFVAEVRGDLPEAVARAETLCNENPSYARGHTVRIRCLPIEVPLLSIKRSTPRFIRRDAEVAGALAAVADRRENWRAGEAYAHQSAKAAPDWPHAYSLVGTSILRREMGGDQPEADYHVVPVNRGRIEEACRFFSRAIDLSIGQPAHPQLAIAYLNRAGAKRLIGDEEGAHLDVEEAFRIDPTDVRVLAKYAHALEGKGKHDEALKLLESTPEVAVFRPAVFMRLLTLSRRRNAGDLDVAVAAALELIGQPDLDEIERNDAHAILCNLYVHQRRPESAINHLRNLNSSVLEPGLRDARLASLIYWHDSKNSEEVVALLTSAVVAARSTSPWFARREIAHICGMLRRYHDAADIMATIISPHLFSDETEEYLDYLLKSKQFSAVREYCKALRSNGQYTEEAMHAECDALHFSSETKEATELLGEWLAWRPNDKIARLHRSALFIARGEISDATFEPSLLPTIDELRGPHDGVQVVHVLRHGPDFQTATDYAHRLARKYPDDEEVQFALISTLMLGRPPTGALPDPKVVGMRHAVTLRSSKGDGRRIVKLIDDHVQHPDEFHISHDVARALLGKQVGESVTLGQDEMVIESVVPNAAIAAKDAMEVFNLRFPKSKLIQKFSVPDSPANPSSVREILGEEWWQMASADDEAIAKSFRLYQTGQVPLTMVARSRMHTTFETALHVLNSMELEVLSAPEQPPFINESLQNARATKTVVIDSTALATVFMFEMSHLLKDFPFDLIVPDTALQEVRKAKYDAEIGLGSYRAGLRDGKFFMTEISHESMKAWASRLQKFIDEVQAACTVVGGSAREKLSFENKKLLEESLGESAFDAIAIAAEHGAVVWTDDQMFGRVANDLCGVSPIWTQALLHVADQRAKKRWRGQYLSEFLLFRFRNTVVFVVDVAQSVKRFKWDLDNPPLAGVRDHLKAHGCTPNNYHATRYLFIALWIQAGRKGRTRVTRAIWSILALFEREAAKRHIARVSYKPNTSPFRTLAPAYSRFRNVLRIWAVAPWKTNRRR